MSSLLLSNAFANLFANGMSFFGISTSSIINSFSWDSIIIQFGEEELVAFKTTLHFSINRFASRSSIIIHMEGHKKSPTLVGDDLNKS